MTITEALDEYRSYRELTDELHQSTLNDFTNGHPSPAISYMFYDNMLKHLTANPLEESLVQNLMLIHVTTQRSAARALCTITIVNVPSDD